MIDCKKQIEDRRIEFRCWSGHKKKMIYDPIQTIDDVNQIFAFGSAIWMQYTGLKDQNGVKIFEGDKVQFPYVTPFGEISKETDGEVVVVTYKNGMFGYSTPIDFHPLSDFIATTEGNYISNHGNIRIYSDCITGRVIGNIFQKSELI